MRRASHLICCCLGICLIASLHSCSEKSAEPAGDEKGTAWEVLRYPAPPPEPGYYFYGMWGSSASDVYLLGYGVIFHYDGFKWQKMTADWGEAFRDAWGDSPSSVFAVGSQGMILHYDGVTWTTESSGVTRDLRAVWGGSGGMYAVGDSGTVLVRRGGRWVIIDSGTNEPLNDVWGDEEGHVFAVGGKGTILDLRFSPARTVESGTGNDLNGVGGNARTGLLAVGALGTIIRFDGTIWKGVRSGTVETLYKVSATSDGQAFAIGAGGRVLRYDGAEWSLMDKLGGLCGTYECTLVGICAASSMSVFVATELNVLHYDGHVWSSKEISPSGGGGGSGGGSLYDIWGSSEHDVYFAGDVSLHYDGASWDTLPYSANFIWGRSATDIYRNGYSGAILHFDGAVWSSVRPLPDDIPYREQPVFRRLWAESGSDIFAVGNVELFPEGGGAGVVCGYISYPVVQYYWWRDVIRCDNNLHDVWGVTHYDVYTVGDGGAILHYNGSTWTRMESGTSHSLSAIWGDSAADIFAVGAQGTIIRNDGTAWSSMASGTTEDLLDVWGSSPDDVFAVGGGGTILHYNGTRWSAMRSPVTSALYGVWGSSPNDVFAVGEYGTILHYGGE